MKLVKLQISYYDYILKTYFKPKYRVETILVGLSPHFVESLAKLVDPQRPKFRKAAGGLDPCISLGYLMENLLPSASSSTISVEIKVPILFQFRLFLNFCIA